MAEITHGSSLEPYRPSKRQIVWLRAIEAEMTSGSAVGGKGLNPLLSCVCMGYRSQLRVLSCLDPERNYLFFPLAVHRNVSKTVKITEITTEISL